MRIRFLVLVFAAAFSLSATPAARAETARDATFAEANSAYAAGHFSEAIKGYEALVAGHHWSANVFYDLVNAYFRAGDPDPPRLHYSVSVSAPETVRLFAASGLDYLVAMLNATDAPSDELLAANLRYTAAQYHDHGEFLQLAGRELAQPLRPDHAAPTALLRPGLPPTRVPGRKSSTPPRPGSAVICSSRRAGACGLPRRRLTVPK